jgi:drug/metabolite transporter (DMT)-like permease
MRKGQEPRIVIGMRSRETSHARRHFLATMSLALAGSFWGTGFLFGKIAFAEMTVPEDVAFRFLAAAIPLLPVLVRHWRPYRGRELGILLLASVIGIPVQYMIQFQGLHLTTVSHASLIVGAIPVLLAASSALVLKERLRRLEWLALAISAFGAAFIAGSSMQATGGPRPDWRGDLLVLVSLFAGVGMILCSKRLIRTHDSLHVTAATVILGTAVLVIWAELAQPLRFHFSGMVWGAALGQGLLATAGAYLLWNWGLGHMPAARAGIFLNLEPVVGTILGVVILHEHLGSLAVLGGLMIIGAGVYFSLTPHQT